MFNIKLTLGSKKLLHFLNDLKKKKKSKKNLLKKKKIKKIKIKKKNILIHGLNN